MIKIVNFPNCCTAKVLFDFGETETNDAFVRREGFYSIPENENKKVMRTELIDFIDRYGHNLLTCITNNQQKTANKLLLELGFAHSTWMSKRAHADTKIRLWWRNPD